jgi:nucleoside-diphosphate-sugar epimerase
MVDSTRPASVMVTGAGGNLGKKTVEMLARSSWCRRVVGVVHERHPEIPSDIADKVTIIRGDLTQRGGSWEAAADGMDAVIHYAAKNPVPDSTWDESLASFDMTQNVGMAALRLGVRRFVFCSSNHAVGGYKDDPLASSIGAGGLRTDLPAGPGTRWTNGDKTTDSTPYATSKLMGERMALALAKDSGGRMTCVSVRVGWTLPGNNRAVDISVSGSPADEGNDAPLDEDGARTLRWFRGMWLSNGDLERLMLASVSADAASWPAPAVVVNGVSNNAGMAWSLEEGRRFLGYEPLDDVYAGLL